MNDAAIALLRCPFCGGALELDRPHRSPAGDVDSGVLCCNCCNFPIVAGIACMQSTSGSTAAVQQLYAGRPDAAFQKLMSFDDERMAELQRLRARGALTFRTALPVCSPDAQGDYMFYRFSDPTFLATRAVVEAAGRTRQARSKAVVDLCGGTGHLARALCELDPQGPVIVTDLAFWPLWLAHEFVAPSAQAVCCDANVPLPFARDVFSLVVCSDAFHYVWLRRLFAGEMLRAAGADGTIVLCHLHNALVENYAAGMPLSPGAYRELFRDLSPVMFGERQFLDAVVAGRPIDLSEHAQESSLQDEAALVLVATRDEAVFEPAATPLTARTGVRRVNPLYTEDQTGDDVAFSLQFPSDTYEQEFEACKRYLPERFSVNRASLDQVLRGEIAPEHAGLPRHVVLSLPEAYL
jgi:SAM-dependent methyltransferase/uncharacterized protein YbaR (Trm112 family)